MKEIGIIQGSSVQAVQLVVGKDTVYVHTDIRKLDLDFEGNPVEDLYEYHEIQYSISEYIALMSEENNQLRDTVDTLVLSALEV